MVNTANLSCVARWWRVWILWCGMVLLLMLAGATQAQPSCGVVDAIAYPIDTNRFVLTQDYRAASQRHHGRFHTGEDWYGGRGASAGQPVRAAARGRVTYAYDLAWGRDGGVVIIEHTFPDGSIAYTQYGHIISTEETPLPGRLTCVEGGEIIGVIADARPAPHLHFEVRVNNPDVPGPGYTWEDPHVLGWRDPGKFITNQQTWLRPSHRWHIMIGSGSARIERGPLAPPLVLSDQSLLYLDHTALRRATPDGRVLWRVLLDRPAVGITSVQNTPLLIYADGTMQRVELDGTVTENWRVNARFGGAPLTAEGWLIIPLADGGIAAIDEERRNILWQLNDIPAPQRWKINGSGANFSIAMLTVTGEFAKISGSGAVINRVPLRSVASFTSSATGQLLAYTRSGLWQIDATGTWTLVMDDTPIPHERSGAALVSRDGRIILFDGHTLHAYTPGGDLLWQTEITGVTGLAELTEYDRALLLTSGGGSIVAIRHEGGVCSQARIHGTAEAKQWHHLGSDGLLRTAIADQLLALNWEQFTRGCPAGTG